VPAFIRLLRLPQLFFFDPKPTGWLANFCGLTPLPCDALPAERTGQQGTIGNYEKY